MNDQPILRLEEYHRKNKFRLAEKEKYPLLKKYWPRVLAILVWGGVLAFLIGAFICEYTKGVVP